MTSALVDRCLSCDEVVEVLTVPGSDATFAQLLRAALQIPASWTTAAIGVAMLVAMIWASGFSGWRTIAVLLLAVAPLYWAIFFTVVRAGGTGGDVVGSSADAELVHDVLAPALRAIFVTAAGAGILEALRATRGGSEPSYTDWRVWAAGLVASACLPSFVASLATGAGLLRALDPRSVVSHAKALGRDYALAAALCAGVIAVLQSWLGTAAYAEREELGFFPIVLRVLSLAGFLVVARIIGLLLNARGEVGYGFRPEQRVLALPGAVPRGTRVRPEAPRSPPPRAPIALEEPSEVERADLPALSRAIEEEDLQKAARIYAAIPELPATALSPSSHLAVGQAAAGQGDFSCAVRALKAAASVAPDHPDAPRACVILARLYAERLGDAASAQRLYRFVVQRYPDTEAARFASQRL